MRFLDAGSTGAGMPGLGSLGSSLNGADLNKLDIGDLFGGNKGSKFARPDTPTPPNYQGLIDEQAKVNRINQNTPFGSLKFTTDPKTGQVTANMAYDPATLAYSDQLSGLQGKYASQAGPFRPQDNSAAVDKATQDSYTKAMALMQPQLTQDQNALTQNMADRGLPIGSEIQGNSQNQFDQYKGGLENQAAYNAIGAGQSLEQQLYGQQLGAYNANMGGMGELSQLQQQLPGLKDFFSPTGVDVNGSAGLAAQGANQNYAALMQQYGSNMGGLFGLGSAAIGAFA